VLGGFCNFVSDKIHRRNVLLFEAQLLYEILKKIRNDNFYTEQKRKWLHQAGFAKQFNLRIYGTLIKNSPQ